ncbi:MULTISPECIES: TetR/AcrR family transcriptional regulator [unclassified Clostridioides]|uniref:TetR/AcrR family transcriptional regulator n=1 Tax=unclassified Clostridioides TaxID=2635829 RepID=UPI001D0C0B8B|nr:TetR/AcrR family transcriptional regulator [Clostridioides sp. ES-S-0001-02]MCC0639332.1 TetR/AcrR family transcriptional regulator [Clostridioides sp. ES-S-0049-03]MCC0672354.1 TetR/AcrR family transcriptional regulator [Clostridioides sp. ES-S-0145-01]MCC0675722.1 TetR/AcrR family transcriptional regulator [Clostridioides sp. ES-W-0018-02]MCC0695486.1 TetR/AcrR family transcriptional regulator [Clostridioides sp. ES-S-0048-02]MCC0709469.1 TetR/AcrR family transcriptional regulator [Clostr
MTNKELQKKRILMYFIEAAQNIMENEGIENITLRKVADMAGYNSSTLYNYFKNLDHLISFASIKYFKDYNLNISRCIENVNDEYKKYIIMWKLFCKHSFENAQAFYQVFFNLSSDELSYITKQYYDMFPEDLGIHDSDISLMITGKSIKERNKILLNNLVDTGYIPAKDLGIINDIIISFYQNLLFLKKNTGKNSNDDELTMKMISSIEYIIKHAK